MIRNTPDRWGLVARLLHWLMAALFVLQLASGWIADQMGRSPAKADLMTGHKSLGITLLLLAALRLLWRWSNEVPALPPATPARDARLAGAGHAALYALTFALPLSGWLAASTSIIPWKLWWLVPWPRLAEPDQGLHDLSSSTHEWLVWALVVLLAVHVAAALRHHFALRDGILLRMWRGNS